MPKHDSRTRVATLKACGFVQLIAVQLRRRWSTEKARMLEAGTWILMGKFDGKFTRIGQTHLHSSGHLWHSTGHMTMWSTCMLPSTDNVLRTTHVVLMATFLLLLSRGPRCFPEMVGSQRWYLISLILLSRFLLRRDWHAGRDQKEKVSVEKRKAAKI